MRGEDILVRRKQRRVNQEDLAKELGVHPMVIGYAEDGRWQPAEAEVKKAIEAIDRLADVAQSSREEVAA